MKTIKEAIKEQYLEGVASNKAESEVIKAYPAEIAYELMEMCQHEGGITLDYDEAIKLAEFVQEELQNNAE